MKERKFFHGEVKADLEEAGYTVFLGTDKELTYMGRENRPSDALAFKGNVVISIEIAGVVTQIPTKWRFSKIRLLSWDKRKSENDD